MNQKTLNIAILSALFSNAVVAHADGKKNSENELPPIVVTSVNGNNSFILTDGELDNLAIDSPKRLLSNVSGVYFENTGSGSLGAVRIRGMGGATQFNSDRVAVNIDGVPIASSFVYGHVSNNGQNTFDTSDLKMVEVQKGASVAGSEKNGLAGTVSFTTKDPSDYLREGQSFGGNVRTGYASENDMYSGGFSLARKFSDKFSSMFSYTYKNYGETPNYDGLDVVGPSRAAINPVNAHSHNVLGKLLYSPNENNEFRLKFESYNMNFNEKILQQTQAASNDYYNKSASNRKMLSLEHKFQNKTHFFDSGEWQIYHQSSKQNRNNDFASFSGTHGINQGHTRYKVKETGISTSLNKKVGSHNLNYGLSIRATDVVTRLRYVSPADGSIRPYQTQPDTKTQSYNAFVNGDVSLADGRFHILPGVSATRYSIKSRATKYYYEPLSKTSKTALTWSIGTTFDINDNHQLFASYRNGLKIPSLLEQNPGAIFAHGLRYEPNPGLKPEKSKSIEAGLKSQGNLGSQTISVFHDKYQGFIDVKRIGPGLNQAFNNPHDVTIYGLEYNGVLDLSKVGAFNGLKLKGALSYTKSRQDTDTGKQGYTSGDPLSGSIGLAYDSPSDTWGVEWTTKFAKAKKEEDIAPDDLNPTAWWASPIETVSGYGVSDLTAYYKPTTGLHINAGVYNVFDKKYAVWSKSMFQQYDKITEPGRNFAINLRYDF